MRTDDDAAPGRLALQGQVKIACGIGIHPKPQPLAFAAKQVVRELLSRAERNTGDAAPVAGAQGKFTEKAVCQVNVRFSTGVRMNHGKFLWPQSALRRFPAMVPGSNDFPILDWHDPPMRMQVIGMEAGASLNRDSNTPGWNPRCHPGRVVE